MQFFKGDDLEQKIDASGEGIMDSLSMQKDLFAEGAFDAMPLGDVLYELGASPLANAILQSIYRESFNTIFQAFVVSGSFESYLTVFSKIFGSSVVVAFTVPGPGKLQISVTADGIEEFDFLARTVVSDAYVFDNVTFSDSDGTGNIELRSIKGFESQYELEQMLFELVPAGIYTEITLSVG